MVFRQIVKTYESKYVVGRYKIFINPNDARRVANAKACMEEKTGQNMNLMIIYQKKEVQNYNAKSSSM